MSQPAPEDDGTVKKRKKPAAKKEKEVNLSGIMFFKRPQLVDTLPEGVKFNRVFAASHYCYCFSEETNELYSWGMGDDYVLGTRDDENVYVPQKVHPKMFYECKIRHIGCGTSHLAVLTAATPESSSEQPPQFDFNLPLPVFEAPPVVSEEPRADQIEAPVVHQEVDVAMDAVQEPSHDASVYHTAEGQQQQL
jgi:hypothetical protein